MNSTINGGNHGNRGDDFPPPLCNRAGKPYPTRRSLKKKTATAEKKKRGPGGVGFLARLGVVRVVRRRNPRNLTERE